MAETTSVGPQRPRAEKTRPASWFVGELSSYLYKHRYFITD